MGDASGANGASGAGDKATKATKATKVTKVTKVTCGRQALLGLGCIIAISVTIALLAQSTRWHHYDPSSLRALINALPAAPHAFAKKEKEASSGMRCLLYDRPPRTGSTTISIVLDACARTRGLRSERVMTPGGRTRAISHMLRPLVAARRGAASVRAHLTLARGDAARLRGACGVLLYVTSARRMARRLLSQLKYGSFDGHGNSSLSVGALASSLRRRSLDRLHAQEAFLEAYPYPPLKPGQDKLQGDRLVPDYVIRQDRLEEDVRALLRALRCDELQLSHDNVHSVVAANSSALNDDDVDDDDDGDDEKVLRRVETLMVKGDQRFRELDALAVKRNARGLQIAAEI